MGTVNIRKKLIDAGVRNLREFGYPACTAENIISDVVYKQFFRRMLKDNQGQGVAEREIEDLLAETGDDA